MAGKLLPAWLQANACTAKYFPADPNNALVANVLSGDVIVHTNHNGNGNISLGAANVVLTLPASGGPGVYTIRGAFWAARLAQAGSRPQDWQVTVNGTPIASGVATSTTSRSHSLAFSVNQTLSVGDRVQLNVTKDTAAVAGDFVGVQLVITSTTPAVRQNGLISAGAFGGFTSIALGSWIEIYGSNLATNTRSWSGTDFKGNAAPLGPQQVTVTNPGGTSPAYNITVNALQPGILAPSSFFINGTQYAAGVFSDGAFVLPAGALTSVNSRPAKPGDVLTLYGFGFGPAVPGSPAGQLVQQLNNLASAFQISIGGMPATVLYAGLAPNYTGLYQFNIIVPTLPAGNAPLTFSLAGAAGIQKLNLIIGN